MDAIDTVGELIAALQDYDPDTPTRLALRVRPRRDRADPRRRRG
jgi:hypothetical protein